MQIAEVASMLERKDAPPPVFLRSIRAGRPGKQNGQLPNGFGLTNHVAVRRNMDPAFDSSKKEIQVINLRAQAFQFQSQRRPNI